MLKYYFRFFLLLGAIIGFIALIGSLLPRGYDFTCEIEIDAPVAVVFDEINRLPNWQTWTTWNPTEVAGLKVDCVGEAGIGCAMTWTDLRGDGKLWITKSQAPHLIEYQMRFGSFPEMSSRFELTESEADKVLVRWNSRGYLPPGPFYGFWAPFFSGHMQYEYQRNLEKLKNKLTGEKGTAS